MAADRHNEGKVPLSLLPLDCLEQVARVLNYGSRKYTRDNWRKGQTRDQIADSMLRHLAAQQRGEVRDLESGELHSAHIATNALFLIWEDLRIQELSSEFSGTFTLSSRGR